MDSLDTTDVWRSEADSQAFRQHVEHEVLSCQSGQQSVLDLVMVLGDMAE